MNIKMSLSSGDIIGAIGKLLGVQRGINDGVDEAIDIAVNEGATIASSADGGMAAIMTDRPSRTRGIIEAVGKAAIIAEFGAGDDTMTAIPFENPPPVDVYPGSWSEQVGSGEYARTGAWHFGGVKFYGGDGQRVLPRQGLYHAKEHIINNLPSLIQGEIQTWSM